MPRWHLPHPRFSLLTLLIGVIFVSACVGLWWHWEPWPCVSLPGPCAPLGPRAEFSPDGKQIALWSYRDASARTQILDVDSLAVRTTLHGVNGVSWTPTGHLCYRTSLFDPETGAKVAELTPPEGYEIYGPLQFSPDNRRVLVESKVPTDASEKETNNVFSLWSTDTFKMLVEIRDEPETHSFFQFSPDGQYLARSHWLPSPNSGDQIECWDAWSGNRLWSIDRKPEHFEKLFFRRDGSLVSEEVEFRSGEKKPFQTYHRQWGLSDGRLLGETKIRESPSYGRRFRVTFRCCDWDRSTFGAYLLEGDRKERRLRLRDKYTKELLWSSPPGLMRSSAAFVQVHPDGERILYSDKCVEGPALLFTRRRPEHWWGLAWLPEFWVAYFAGGALLVIAARNLRRRWAAKTEAA